MDDENDETGVTVKEDYNVNVSEGQVEGSWEGLSLWSISIWESVRTR